MKRRYPSLAEAYKALPKDCHEILVRDSDNSPNECKILYRSGRSDRWATLICALPFPTEERDLTAR
jgi:hypothetical protein